MLIQAQISLENLEFRLRFSLQAFQKFFQWLRSFRHDKVQSEAHIFQGNPLKTLPYGHNGFHRPILLSLTLSDLKILI